MAIITPEADAHARRLCSRLAIERTALGLTQRDMAAHFGDQQGNVQTIETMGRRPTLPTFVSYASALGLEVALVGGHHLPLLDLTADEVKTIRNIVALFAERVDAIDTEDAIVAGALDKLTTTDTTEETT